MGGPGDLLAEATNSIVLPMTAEGVQTMTYNPNLTSSSIVGKKISSKEEVGKSLGPFRSPKFQLQYV